MIAAAVFFFAGAVLYALLSRVLGYRHAIKMIQNSAFVIVLAMEQISRQLAIEFDLVRKFRVKYAACSREDERKQADTDEELIEAFQTAVIVSFFKFTPKNLHPVIPFSSWPAAVKAAHNFLDRSTK